MKQTFRLVLMLAVSMLSLRGMAQCDAPANLNYTYSGASVSTFSWDAVAGAASYEIEFQTPGYGWAYLEYATTTPTNSVDIPGIYPSGTFEYRVRAVCTNNTVSAYSSTSQFSVPCIEPRNISVSAVSTNAATINFEGEAGWNYPQWFRVGYRVLGSGNWWTFTTNSTTTTATLTGLNPGTVYEFIVTGICHNFNSASISGQFTTTISYCIASGSNATEWIDLFRVGSINRSSGADADGYVNTGIATNLTIGNIYNATFSAGFSGGNKSERFAVYIDLNRNGNFNDAGERVYGFASTSNGNNKNFSFRVPVTATAGVTRMRVVMARSTYTATGCSTVFLGEVEDYTVNLVSGTNNKTDETTETTFEENFAIGEDFELPVSVYPNPSSSIFNISGSDDNMPVSLAVYSVDGKVVQQLDNHQSNHIMLDLSGINEGIYLLQLTDVNGVKTSHKLYKK